MVFQKRGFPKRVGLPKEGVSQEGTIVYGESNLNTKLDDAPKEKRWMISLCAYTHIVAPTN